MFTKYTHTHRATDSLYDKYTHSSGLCLSSSQQRENTSSHENNSSINILHLQDFTCQTSKRAPPRDNLNKCAKTNAVIPFSFYIQYIPYIEDYIQIRRYRIRVLAATCRRRQDLSKKRRDVDQEETNEQDDNTRLKWLSTMVIAVTEL